MRHSLAVILAPFLCCTALFGQSPPAAGPDALLEATQAGRSYVELGKYPMNEVIMASPAISDGRIISRTLVLDIGR